MPRHTVINLKIKDNEKILKATVILSIPSNYHVTCLLPVGYPKEIKDHNERNDVGDFVFYK